ncbi:hypothetical protein HYALB_00002965 [Hymenoscyphus albidus]|uniref:Uncharacterized protein n=1 Tax=Hymenoscyphus albidus TaxID=595503 RepID=A0A9N9M3K5_9HELO|nr:hypothetical protein HYALB_00002965 [Hymenoscyphus albidus]
MRHVPIVSKYFPELLPILARKWEQIPSDLVVHCGSASNSSVGSTLDYSSAGDFEEAEEARQAEENAVSGTSKVEEKNPNPEESSFQKLGSSQEIKLLINSTISQDHTGGLDQSEDAVLVALAQKLSKPQAISFGSPSQNEEQGTEEKSAWMMEDFKGANSRKLGRRDLDAMSRRPRESSPDWGGHPMRDLSQVMAERVVERTTRRPTYQAPRVSYGDTGRSPRVRYSPVLQSSSPPMPSAGKQRPLDPFDRIDAYSEGDSAAWIPEYELKEAMAERQKPPLLSHTTVEDEFEKPALREEMNKYLEQALKATDEELRKAQRALSNMTSEENSNMAESELDPITYYFACLKDKAQPSQGIEHAVKSRITQPSIDKKSENLENPGKGKCPSEASDEAVFSKLEDLRSLLTPEEQLNIGSCIGKKPYIGKRGTFKFSLRKRRPSGCTASLSNSTKASSYPEAREADHTSTASISMSPRMKPTSECGSPNRGTRKGNPPRSSLPISTVRQVKSPSLTAELLQNTGRERSNRGISNTSIGDRSNKKSNVDSPSSQTPASRLTGQLMGGKIASTSSTLPPILREDRAAMVDPKPRAKPSSPISHSEQAEDLCQDRDQQKQASSQSSDLLIIRGLQQRIAKLQQEKERGPKYRVKEEEATRVQIIYKVYCLDKKSFSYFLDKPLEYDDHPDQTFHLHGQKPFPNDVDLFIELQRGALSFLFYKELRCCKPKRLEEDLPVKEPETPAVQEIIRVTSEKLHKAYIFLRKRYPDEMKYFPEFKVNSQITSPLDDLPDEHLSQVRLSRQHIEASFRDEFARVETLISEENITAQYLAYLFEPGTVVIEKKGDAYAGYEQVDWPSRKTRPKRNPIQSAIDDRQGANVEISADQLYIQGHNWHFDGEFSMNWQELYADYGDSKQHVKPINELALLPLRFAGLEVAEELRRRGSIFWSCRVRRFVSYNTDNNMAEHKVTSDQLFLVYRQD